MPEGPWDSFRWSDRTVEEVARVLYDRWRNQGPRLGFLPDFEDSMKPWAELTEARREHFISEARDALNEMLTGYNK